MSVISNTPRPDEGPPTAPPNIVSAPVDVLPPSPACSESTGVGPDRITLGVTALEAGRDAPYKNTRSHKHIAKSPTTVAGIQAELARTECSLAPTPSTGIKHEISLLRTVVDEDQTTYIPPAHPEHINIVVDDPSPQHTPCTGHSLLSQLPAPQESNQFPPLNPIPEGCIPSTAPTPQLGALLTTESETVQIAKSMYQCTLGAAFENLGKGFVFPMSYPEKEVVTKLLPDTFFRFQKELHWRVKPVEGHPIALSPHENDVWTEIFAAAHGFMSELSHYLGLLGMPFAEGSMPPTPIILSPPRIPSSFPTNAFSTEKLISSADAIQAAVFAVHSRLITDSNTLDIAHDLARAKRASNEQVEAHGSAAPSGALATPRENLPDQAGHGTAPAYMDAAPPSALGLSFGSTAPDPYGPYGKPTFYNSFGQPPTTDPLQDPSSRAFSQISWATLTAPPHETHPVEDSMHPSPIPAPISSLPAPKLPVGPPDVPKFTQVNWGKNKGKNKGASSTPKKSFAAIAASSLPVSGIQQELAKLNKPNSAPASLPSAPANPSKQAKNKSPSPPGNLDLIIKVSTEPDRQLVIKQAGKTSIMPVQFSYGTNRNCYISFSPATKIEEVELFRGALASCINIAGPFIILRAGKWTKMMISHVPVWRTDPITGEEHHEINTKKDLMMLLQLFVPNDLLDEFPVQDVRFLHPLNYVDKTAPGGHETIVLSVEDKSNWAFEAYKNHGLTFGYRSCYIRPFVDKKLTAILGHICRCPPKCPACKKDHPFSDLDCPTRGCYAPSLSNILRMEGFTGSRTPASVHHSPAASGMSAHTPHPSTTAPGLINTEVSALPPPVATAKEDHEMAASCFDVIIFADPWWGPIGSLKNDSDSNKCIFGSVANPKWTCVSPPIDTQLPSNHPSTLIYIQKGCNISADVDPNSPACRHYYFIDIMVNDFAFKLCPVYLHGNNLTALAREFLQVPILESPTLICGDFNIQHPDLSEVLGAKIKKSALGNEFLNWIQSNDLSVHNDLTEVTRVSPDETSSSIIDYTLSNPLLDSYDVVSNWAISFPLSLCSDHGAISFDVTCPYSAIPSRSHTSIKISEENAERWIEEFECYMDLAGLPETVETIEDLENLAQHMLDAMSEATNRSMETKTFTDKAKSDLRPLLELKSLSSHLWFCIKRAKRTFFDDIIKKAHQGEEASTTNSIWEINRWWRGHKVSNLPTLKQPDSSLAMSNGQKAALFHSTFFPHIPCSPPATLLDTFPQKPQFSLPPILESEIADSLALCHNRSAPGAFGTNYLLLKWAFEACPALFTQLYNTCIQLRFHLVCLRNALILPIPKPNRYNMASPKSYWPIALLETLSKLLEKIVAKHITAMAGRLNLIPPDQFGGKEKSSCLDAGLAFVHDVQTAHAQKCFASAALLDISGYYNNIDHQILVRITEKMGFPPDYSGWLASYLTDRKACFRINGEIGEFFDLANCGVPQGSPLSPVFSSLFTAPLLYRLRSKGMNIHAYIDDIMILTTATSQEGCVSNLIHDIHDLTNALGDLGLSAEMSKTELIHFARMSHCMTKNLPVRLGNRAKDIVHLT
ncbi:Reverse transcriptase from mobile element jockey protein [Ceratobasidium theobromae]|uniref:Reverse transcriptase from mobile element jockey protein n=1 Tax=Ceratobasidium theobromae TaxID=1582974 RepID=A0A5N5Q8L0_9AGAM|nr:Reverse transcriptase from mobile element jockey protein [Ceratobasidium theobromae]